MQKITLFSTEKFGNFKYLVYDYIKLSINIIIFKRKNKFIQKLQLT